VKKLKSNEYVYTYAPFKNLKRVIQSGKKDDFFFDRVEISLEDIKKTLKQIGSPRIVSNGKKVEEKIFSIFLDQNVIFGPKKFVNDYRVEWLEKIQYFVSKKKKIIFTLLGFPFKIPVPLKTNRRYPDMGEVLILWQLFAVVSAIRKIYQPGAEIVIFTEGGLGIFVGVSKSEADEYKKFLMLLNKRLGFSDAIKIRDLSDMEKEDNFSTLFRKNKSKFQKDLENKNEAFMKKFEGAKPSLIKIINTRKFSEQVLAEVYDDRISDEKISATGKKIRTYIESEVKKSLVGYFAYLKTRDDLDFLENKVPHFLALSVSPKPGRLGIIPVNAWSERLPYHSVPVYNKTKKKFTMKYLVEVKYGNEKIEACFLLGDEEKKPFYYVVKK